MDDLPSFDLGDLPSFDLGDDGVAEPQEQTVPVEPTKPNAAVPDTVLVEPTDSKAALLAKIKADSETVVIISEDEDEGEVIEQKN